MKKRGKIKNITGKIFGRLIVLSYSHVDENRKACWNCICSCGKKVIIMGESLRTRNTRSCGCLKIDIMKKTKRIHGESKTRLYSIWLTMKGRCNNPNNIGYKNYGGRGISVEWKNYLAFKTDMGRGHENHVKKYGKTNTSIDRIDNDGNYSRDNCRWATRKEQNSNTRRSHLLTLRGMTKTISQWAQYLNIPKSTIYARINLYGWSIERALTTGML